MLDTLMGIVHICDADRRRLPGSEWLATTWTLDDCVKGWLKAGFHRDEAQAAEWEAEVEARRIGKEKGIRFRRYDRWGEWPIKAYGPGKTGEEARDFKTWKEAYTWVKGI